VKKIKFEVEENETIESCLDRMKRQGYTPVRRIEIPVFKEVNDKGQSKPVVYKQKIVFEGKMLPKPEQ
jgi:hypothetical protein